MTLGEKVSENFELIILLLGLTAIQLFNSYFPEYYMMTGWVSLCVIGLLIGGMHLYAITEGRRLPYLECLTYPSRQKLKIYIQKYQYSRPVGSKANPIPFFATKILSKNQFNYQPLGKCAALVINHEHTWTSRTDFKDGKAEYKGIIIDHPFKETLILHESSMTDVDKTEPIPVFFLAHAGKDFWRQKIQKEKVQSGGVGCEKCDYIEKNVELERENKELRQKLIELEQFIEKIKDALRGVQRAGTKGVVELVWILFNEIHSLHVTISNALKSRGIMISLPLKLAIIGACFLGFIGLAGFRPEIFTQFSQILSEPLNMIFVTAATVFAILIAYYLIRRRSV